MRTPARLLLATALLTGPAAGSGPVWVGCFGGAYSIDFLVDPGKPEILEFVLLVDGQRRDSHNWKIVTRNINLRDKSLRFAAQGRSRPHRDFQLTVADAIGQLGFGDHRPVQSLQMSCYWDVIGE
jgi:hypothetical protein